MKIKELKEAIRQMRKMLNLVEHEHEYSIKEYQGTQYYIDLDGICYLLPSNELADWIINFNAAITDNGNHKGYEEAARDFVHSLSDWELSQVKSFCGYSYGGGVGVNTGWSGIGLNIPLSKTKKGWKYTEDITCFELDLDLVSKLRYLVGWLFGNMYVRCPKTVKLRWRGSKAERTLMRVHGGHHLRNLIKAAELKLAEMVQNETK